VVAPSRTWVTEEKHVANANNYESRKLIVAKKTELLLSNQLTSLCKNEPCVRMESTMRLECLRNEGEGKFRVRRYVNG